MYPTPKKEAPIGAPIGNHNARKHGLSPRPSDTADIDRLNLDQELQSLRYYFRKLAETSLTLTDPLAIADVLRTLTFASLGISRLVRTQLIVLPTQSTAVAAEIGRIVDEVRHELSSPEP